MTSASTQQPQLPSSADLLRQTLHQFQIDGYLCDTELVAIDGSLKAHAVLLAATSSVFKSALKLGTQSNECIITVPGIALHLLKIVVCFAYTGEIMIPKENLTEEYLSTVISVLEQLGFTLSAVIASDHNGDKPSVIADCSHVELLARGEPNEKESSDSDALDVIHHNEGLSDNSEKLKLPVSPDHVGSDISIDLIRDKKSKLRAGGKIVMKPKKPRQKNVSSPKLAYISDEGGNVSSQVTNAVAKNEDDAVVLSDNNLCDICGVVFDDIAKYRSHKMKFHRRRKKDLPVKCQQCGVQFANQPNLRRHMYQHTGERPHLCPHCGEGFIQRRTMQDHVISCHPDKVDRHSNFVSYKCRKCGEILHNTCTYRRHMKWHKSGEFVDGDSQEASSLNQVKPYACEKCGRRFAYKATLIIHNRRHADDWALRKPTRHEPWSERNTSDNVCTTCGKKFKYYATLLAHERTHTGEKPFTCSECGRKLAQPTQLIEHMRIHTGEKPYKCEICGKQMRQRAHLTVHMRTHTGEKPYGCQLCHKSYRQITDLRLHYRRVHQFELPKDPHRRPFNFGLQLQPVCENIDNLSVVAARDGV